MNTADNKALVTRYNKEVIEKGDMAALKEMLSGNFVNHSALPGMDAGMDGMIYFFTNILHLAFPGLEVNILDMVAEGNKVTTRKAITATHQGILMGIPATGKPVTIRVIDILTIEDGRITEHWGENNFAAVVKELAG